MSAINDEERFLRLALDACRRGIEAGQSPFGSCVVRDGEVLSTAHNRVWEKRDVSAHAEVEALRGATGRAGTIDLSGATIYSTTEPCPMCFAAIHWARIRRIVSATTIADVRALGFCEIDLDNTRFKEAAGLDVELRPGVLRAESLALLAEWAARPERRAY